MYVCVARDPFQHTLQIHQKYFLSKSRMRRLMRTIHSAINEFLDLIITSTQIQS